jgi:hypothetical protein
MTTTPHKVIISDRELAKAEAEAYKNKLNEEWARNKASELRKAGDHEQADAFDQFVSGSLSYKKLLKDWGYKYWTFREVNNHESDPFLPKSNMTREVFVDRGSYLHPLNPHHDALGKPYLESRGKVVIQDSGNYYMVTK